MEFLKGETEPTGDCGNFTAGIDVHGADQFPNDSRKRTWYHRVECYGNTAEQAEELRDKVLALLVSTEHDGELHKAVFLALDAYGGADTFRDGVLALVQQSKERGGRLDKAVEIINSWKSVFGEAMARRATLYVETDAFLSGAESPEVEAPGAEALAAPTPPQPTFDEASERDRFDAEYEKICCRTGITIREIAWRMWQSRDKAGEVGHE